jgi:hypothetical protein
MKKKKVWLALVVAFFCAYSMAIARDLTVYFNKDGSLNQTQVKELLAREGYTPLVAKELAEFAPDQASEIARIAIEAAPQFADRIALYCSKYNPAQAIAILNVALHADLRNACDIARSVATSVPDRAAEIAKIAAEAAPESAVCIAKAVSSIVPDRAAEIAKAVIKAVPNQAAAITRAVISAAPKKAEAIKRAAKEALEEAPPEAYSLPEEVPPAKVQPPDTETTEQEAYQKEISPSY